MVVRLWMFIDETSEREVDWRNNVVAAAGEGPCEGGRLARSEVLTGRSLSRKALTSLRMINSHLPSDLHLAPRSHSRKAPP